MEKLMPRVKHGRYILLPTTEQTRGHGTHTYTNGGKYVGEFKDGVGEFFDQEPWKGRAVFVRFVWSNTATAGIQVVAWGAAGDYPVANYNVH